MMGGNIYWKEKKKQQLLSQNVKRTRKVKKQLMTKQKDAGQEA